MSKIAFKPEEATDALKEFVGQVVEIDYSLSPFDFKGAAEIKRDTKVLGLKIRTDAYEKEQYEWYPPSKVKKTKTGRLNTGWVHMFWSNVPSIGNNLSVVKWLYFIEALNQCGAMKDVSVSGTTDDERMTSMGRSLLGMVFRWQELECESMVKVKGVGGGQKKFSVLLPVEYMGKKPIETPPVIKQATIGESTPTPGGID